VGSACRVRTADRDVDGERAVTTVAAKPHPGFLGARLRFFAHVGDGTQRLLREFQRDDVVGGEEACEALLK
jgi:hypothetical protein